MSKQADIEFLFILALENYAKTSNLTYEESAGIFHKNNIMEKMLVQHEYLHQVALEEVFDFISKNISEKKGLILYHGSASFFEKIDLAKSQNRRDFGKGFYTTVLEGQAKNGLRFEDATGAVLDGNIFRERGISPLIIFFKQAE